MMDLKAKHCIPCEGGTPPLDAERVKELEREIDSEWKIEENKKLVRTFRFGDFKEAMAFVNRVAALAEEEGHHPDIHISWNKVMLELSTHAAHGLSENDFILASKIAAL